MNRYKDEQEKQDRRFGRICAVLANINRKESSKAFSEEDFIPKPAPPPQTADQQIAIFTTIAAFAEAKYGGGETQNEQAGTPENEKPEED